MATTYSQRNRKPQQFTLDPNIAFALKATADKFEVGYTALLEQILSDVLPVYMNVSTHDFKQAMLLKRNVCRAVQVDCGNITNSMPKSYPYPAPTDPSTLD